MTDLDAIIQAAEETRDELDEQAEATPDPVSAAAHRRIAATMELFVQRLLHARQGIYG